jgi:hypothetical protein
MEWKQIDGYNYSVSINGEVRNDKTGLILKQTKTKDGYYHIRLSKNGTQKTHKVHRLAALAFIPNPKNKPVVDHLDCIITNNSVENLRWATRKQNNQNQSLSKRNTSGYKGVILNNGKWRAQIMVDRKYIYLGRFDTIEEAAAVRSARANQVFGVFTNACERT